MVPLWLILVRGNTAGRADFAKALRRFSNAGHVAAGLVIASGIVNTWLIPGHLPLDGSSPYQVMLAIKIIAVAVVSVFGMLEPA